MFKKLTTSEGTLFFGDQAISGGNTSNILEIAIDPQTDGTQINYNFADNTYITFYNNSSLDIYSIIGSDIDGHINAVALSSDNSSLYIGGSFTLIGELNAKRIAKYNIETGEWSALGTGLNNEVNAIAVSPEDNTLYVGGHFTSAGGEYATYIAKYDIVGQNWMALTGYGTNNDVNALVVSPDNSSLFVGGNFTTVGGSLSANRIAKYDITNQNWVALGGSGMNYAVQALVVSPDGTSLFAGGNFTIVNGNAVNNLAKYNIVQNEWSKLGNLNDTVYALAVSPNGSSLYIGGNFLIVDDLPVNRIAKYNIGSGEWSALGDGLNNTVNALVVLQDEVSLLFVGGSFTTADGLPANRLAKYNIDTYRWSALGDDLNNTVNALAVSPNGSLLYVSGEFNYFASINLNSFCDISINNQFITTLSKYQYQIVNAFSSGNIYKVYKGQN